MKRMDGARVVTAFKPRPGFVAENQVAEFRLSLCKVRGEFRVFSLLLFVCAAVEYRGYTYTKCTRFCMSLARFFDVDWDDYH